jgi:N utilization substance protein B
MRIALVEMLYPGAVPSQEPIPAEGAIEEAVESAKTFCSSEAPGFVNGVLAAVLREVRENAHIR